MTEQQTLDGGLVLRDASPDDHDGIVELSAAAHGEPDGVAVRHLLARHDAPGEWLVVVDGDQVVSTCILLAQTLRVGNVELPVGQVEYVATEPDHRRWGLVALQFAEHHRRSAERGDLVNLVYGIPYFYRRLGYGYGSRPGRSRRSGRNRRRSYGRGWATGRSTRPTPALPAAAACRPGRSWRTRRSTGRARPGRFVHPTSTFMGT